eukprot:1147320-Rhodomonas_salina.1
MIGSRSRPRIDRLGAAPCQQQERATWQSSASDHFRIAACLSCSGSASTGSPAGSSRLPPAVAERIGFRQEQGLVLM